MNIAVIGTGYVGLVAGACLADIGNNVICVDNDIKKLESLQNGIIQIFEPGLEELVKANVKEKRLSFSSNVENAVQLSEVIFIAVGSPQASDGSADLSQIFEVTKSIAKAMNGYKVIVNKSTVPVGTAEKCAKIIKSLTAKPFDIVSNPEFLKQGNAVNDFLHADRVIIGSDSTKATYIMVKLYSPFFRTENRIIIMDVKSAEVTKYAANAFLATKISFMNEIANFCEKVGADVEMVRHGLATDLRIGNKFLFPGIGYGGSCFPKDINALIKTGEEHGIELSIIKQTDMVNTKQKYLFLDKILTYFANNVAGLTFGVLGLAFKPKTDDMREAPSITIINELLNRGAKIKVYDPKAMENARKLWGEKIVYSKDLYDAIRGTDAIILLTEWNEFRSPDVEKIKSAAVFDGRNLWTNMNLNEKGIDYFKIG